MGKSSETQTASMDPLQQKYMEQFIMPQAEAVKGMEFTPFTGERVAGMTDLQRQAQAGYAGLGVPEQYGQAGSVFSEIAGMTPEQRAADIAQYTQQYTAGVIDPTIAMMERERAKARTGEEAAIAKAGAFGSRGDVLRGEREGEYQARMGQTLGQLQQQGYQQAVARQQAEAAQRLGAAGQLAGLGAQQFQTQLAGLGAQMGAGEAERLIGQQGLDAAYQQYMMEQQFPLTQFSALTGGSAAFPAGIGTTTGSVYDPMGSFGKAAKAGSDIGQMMSFLSDERLKEDIKLDSTYNGVNFYTWKWNEKANEMGLSGGDFGVIAQEVEQHMPHVVSIGDDGYRRVNYTKLYQELGA